MGLPHELLYSARDVELLVAEATADLTTTLATTEAERDYFARRRDALLAERDAVAAELDELRITEGKVRAALIASNNAAKRRGEQRDALATTLATYRDELQAAVDWMDNPDGEPSSSTLVDRWRALLSDTPDTEERT